MDTVELAIFVKHNILRADYMGRADSCHKYLF